MARDERVTVRVEKSVKQEAETVFRNCGISMSDAVNLFLHRAVLENGLPFPVNGSAKTERSVNHM